MEEKDLEAGELIGKLKEYVAVRKELAVLSAVDKGSRLFGNLVTNIIVLILVLMTIVFGSFALGFYLSEVIGNTYSGFLIVTGFYLFLAVFLYLTKSSILERFFVNISIKKFLKDRNDSIDENQDTQ